MCADNWQTSSSEEKYGLLEAKSEGCKGKTNSGFTAIDQIPAKDFFTLNQPLINGLPGYAPGSTDVMTLAYRPYIYWKMDCRENLLDDIVNIIFNAIGMLSSILNCAYLGFASVGVAVLGIFALCCECCKKDEDDPYKVRCCCGYGVYCSCCLCIKRCWKKKSVGESCWDYFQLIDPLVFLTVFLHALLVLLTFIVGIGGVAKVFATEKLVIDLNSKKCSDDLNN